ncbi:hypothetical protein FOZ60_016664 [Perkinsus olseni]|uniref:WRKY19-like zinc finger domain-containing protein n=1 Tax=Perkinsus olseni TaxID=32597 RepID=A0A7J6PKJ3_PEROL|nr:hypothetical protein FOZ60_016664 [Perkinsus olseni]KAF4706419.1 hypothetical protein FOZ62_006992 [Perkinsus olseni]
MPIVYCSVASCTRHARSGGLCISHGGGRRCSVEGCDKTARRQGLCQRHGGRPDNVRPKKSTPSRRGRVADIETVVQAVPIIPASVKEWDLWFESDKQLTLPKLVEIRDHESRGIREYVIHV